MAGWRKGRERREVSLVPVVVAAGDYTNDNLPGHGGGAVAVQHNLPVVLPVREHCIGTHTHPECILPNANCVAIVADASPGVLQVGIPQEGCVYGCVCVCVCMHVCACE